MQCKDGKCYLDLAKMAREAKPKEATEATETAAESKKRRKKFGPVDFALVLEMDGMFPGAPDRYRTKITEKEFDEVFAQFFLELASRRRNQGHG